MGVIYLELDVPVV